MDNIEKYRGVSIEPHGSPYAGGVESLPPHEEPAMNIGAAILRHWRMIVSIVAAAAVVGLPIIWMAMRPAYSVTGAIRVAPILPDILTGEADADITNYSSFVNTQAEIVASSQVIQRVADELANRKLRFFDNPSVSLVNRLDSIINKTSSGVDAAGTLREAIARRDIRVIPPENSELIKITMKCVNPEEGKQIVNAFIRAYMANEVSASTKEQDQKLGVLENEQKVLADKLQNLRGQIRQLAQEYGTKTLDGRQNMMLSHVTDLLSKLTEVETRKANLEGEVQLLEQNQEESISPQELLKMRNDYINSDPSIKETSQQIAQLEYTLVQRKKNMTLQNPFLKQEEEPLKVFKAKLEEKKQELSKNFDVAIAAELSKAKVDKLNKAKMELAQVEAYEKRLQEKLAKEDTQTIEVGRKQLSIQEIEDQLSLTKTTYDQVSRRIQELEMERKRPARVSIAFDADIDPVDSDKRPKATAGLMFGSFAIGVILALIREKADKSLHTPAEVAKRIGIRVIGTTTSTSSVNLAELPDIITQDYQAICSNLGVFNGEGVPARLLVTSPGIAEGKTTFAINLATSLSQAGKKVLLIDGDLRKPDVAHVLHLPKGLRGLQDAAFGKDPMASVYSVGPNGLDVLAADSRNTSDAYQLLSLIFANKVVESLSSNYDHVIIDTPPVLAFPDATIWARMADGAVLMSLAGQTTAADLNEAKEKLMPTKIKVLGIVLGNVHVGHGYHRYGYGYYSDRNRMSKQRANRKFLLLPSHGVSNDKPPEGDAV